VRNKTGSTIRKNRHRRCKRRKRVCEKRQGNLAARRRQKKGKKFSWGSLASVGSWQGIDRTSRQHVSTEKKSGSLPLQSSKKVRKHHARDAGVETLLPGQKKKRPEGGSRRRLTSTGDEGGFKKIKRKKPILRERKIGGVRGERLCTKHRGGGTYYFFPGHRVPAIKSLSPFALGKDH